MATMIHYPAIRARTGTFWFVTAVLMTILLVAGFAFQVGMGRSSFAVPLYVHAHALVFFGWTMLYLAQNGLIAADNVALHRRLGWLAVGWIPAMMVTGTVLTMIVVRRGTVPVFFTPCYFLSLNTLTLVDFAGLACASIVRRRSTQWHRRLMFCAMVQIIGPGFGRLLPMPLVIPWAGWTLFAAFILFPIAGAIRDWRRSGRVHPAWIWGIGALAGTQIAVDLLANSSPGQSYYRLVTHGAPGAGIAPLAYPPLPRR